MSARTSSRLLLADTSSADDSEPGSVATLSLGRRMWTTTLDEEVLCSDSKWMDVAWVESGSRLVMLLLLLLPFANSPLASALEMTLLCTLSFLMILSEDWQWLLLLLLLLPLLLLPLPLLPLLRCCVKSSGSFLIWCWSYTWTSDTRSDDRFKPDSETLATPEPEWLVLVALRARKQPFHSLIFTEHYYITTYTTRHVTTTILLHLPKKKIKKKKKNQNKTGFTSKMNKRVSFLRPQFLSSSFANVVLVGWADAGRRVAGRILVVIAVEDAHSLIFVQGGYTV